MIYEFQNKFVSDFDNIIKNEVVKRLKKVNINFSSDEEFLTFIKNRITSVKFFSESIDTVKLYLDYSSEVNKGFFILEYTQQVDVSIKNGDVFAVMLLKINP